MTDDDFVIALKSIMHRLANIENRLRELETQQRVTIIPSIGAPTATVPIGVLAIDELTGAAYSSNGTGWVAL